MTTTAGRFVGQSIKRREDPRLVTGHGRYVDDVVVPGMLHAAFVRSDLPRARITGIDVSEAAALDGVFAVLTADDLNPLIAGPLLPTMFVGGNLGLSAPMRALASGDVRFVGDPVVIVVAESRYIAEDACELITIDYEPLSPIVDFEQAVDATELVHGELQSNVISAVAVPAAGLDETFGSAAAVITETFHQHRQTNVPMETRGIVAHFDPADQRLQVWMSSQNPHEVRLTCSRILGIPENLVRVTQQDVGGGFGQKFFMPRDEITVVLASRRLGRPIKWIEDRRENLIASNHARTDRLAASVAVDADGHFLAAKIDHLEDAGAFPMGGSGGAGAFVAMLYPGPYRLPKLEWATTAVFTNTCSRGAYRGPWMMETVAREQMVDTVARAIGMDPLELRRRNVITADDLPYTTAGGLPYTNISPAETLEQAAALIGYDEFRAQQASARADGRYLGIGMGLYIEPQTGMGAMGVEAAIVRVAPTGRVDVYIGSGSHGQSLETTIAQVVAEELGVDIDDITVHQGDTESAPYGGGTGGSRSAPILSPAAAQAARQVREKAIAIAAHLLEAASEDLDVAGGVVSVAGTPSRSVTIADVARVAYLESDRLPPGTEPGLEVVSRFKAPPVMYSNACHACTVEVDPATGRVQILRYVVSEDCGVMINPMVVEGQIAGGVVQGIGGVLYEHAAYDEDGNPLATTFMDYLLPTAAEVPRIEYGHIETPATTPGGYKGMGEGGAIGSPPAVFNAVADALAPLGVTLNRTPLGPSQIVAAIAASENAG
ncbi:MAG TPA: molybdopterin cofactor-binding domain-containing protein [Thermoleophilia bacterium]|nr:molybdopterin cofactor-binding domain-containing protein [Thermoleophilia bacterium]